MCERTDRYRHASRNEVTVRVHAALEVNYVEHFYTDQKATQRRQDEKQRLLSKYQSTGSYSSTGHNIIVLYLRDREGAGVIL